MLLRILIFSALLVPALSFASCKQFEQEAEAYSGVVPRLDSNGHIVAYIMYGEATFVSPTRSLIANARRRAEMNAKAAFTEFLESDFSSETLTQDMVNSIQLTDHSGNTAALAEEISTSLNTMRSNASATLSGIVKLDECVDTEGRYVMVALGWKPEMSAAARGATRSLEGGETSAIDVQMAAPSGAQADQAPGQASLDQQRRREGSMEIITVTTQGIGATLRAATNEALRMAVSQVHGEAFASESVSIDTVAELQVTSSSGETQGAAVEHSLSQQQVASSTAGIIRSWRYVQQNETATGFTVSVEVTIPQYQSMVDPNRLTVVVAAPALNSNVSSSTAGLAQFRDILRRNLEQTISQTNKLTVLERQHMSAISSELNRISATGNTAEMARLGQQVGADLVVIPVIERFSSRNDVREVGQSVIERQIFDVEVSIRVAEVATSNLVATRSFPLNNRRVRPDNAVQMVANLVMQPINGFIGTGIGGGFNPGFQSTMEPQPDIAELTQDAQKRLNEARRNAERDW